MTEQAPAAGEAAPKAGLSTTYILTAQIGLATGVFAGWRGFGPWFSGPAIGFLCAIVLPALILPLLGRPLRRLVPIGFGTLVSFVAYTATTVVLAELASHMVLEATKQGRTRVDLLGYTIRQNREETSGTERRVFWSGDVVFWLTVRHDGKTWEVDTYD